jgi:hypothetical protein
VPLEARLLFDCIVQGSAVDDNDDDDDDDDLGCFPL